MPCRQSDIVRIAFLEVFLVFFFFFQSMPDYMCCPSTVQFSRNLLNDEISPMSNGHLESSRDITLILCNCKIESCIKDSWCRIMAVQQK